MNAHTIHPDVHTHGLADHCGRCREHALEPLTTLDADMLSGLYDRTVRWMNGDPDALSRSENEALAMRNLETAINNARALGRLGVDL